MYIALAKFWSARRASYQPAFMYSCLTVGQTHFCLVYLVDVLPQGVLQPFLIGLNVDPSVFLSMVYFKSYGKLVLL